MRRKSERNKSKSSPEKKPVETRKSRRTSRRRKRSSSHSASEDSDNVPLKSAPSMTETREKEIISPSEDVKKPESHSNSDEDKQEQPVWKVKTADTSSGEIQKLKICLQRPPTTPERTEKSPRRKRNKPSSQSDEAYLTPDEKPSEKPQGRRKLKRGSGSSMDSKNDLIDSAEKDECLVIVTETNVATIEPTNETTLAVAEGKLDCKKTTQESHTEKCVQLTDKTEDKVELVSKTPENIPETEVTEPETVPPDSEADTISSKSAEFAHIVDISDTISTKSSESVLVPESTQTNEVVATNVPETIVLSSELEKMETEIVAESDTKQDIDKVAEISAEETASAVSAIMETSDETESETIAATSKDVEVSETETPAETSEHISDESKPEPETTKTDIPECSKLETQVKEISETEAEMKEVSETEAEVKEVSETEAEVKKVSETEAEVKKVSETEAEMKEVSETEAEVKEVSETKEIESVSETLAEETNTKEVLESVKEEFDSSKEGDAKIIQQKTDQDIVEEVEDKTEASVEMQEPSEVSSEKLKNSADKVEKTLEQSEKESPKSEAETGLESDSSESKITQESEEINKEPLESKTDEEKPKITQKLVEIKEKTSESDTDKRNSEAKIDKSKEITKEVSESDTDKQDCETKIDKVEMKEVDKIEKETDQEKKSEKISENKEAQISMEVEKITEQVKSPDSDKTEESKSPSHTPEPRNRIKEEIKEELFSPRERTGPKRNWGQYKVPLKSEERITSESIMKLCPSVRMLSEDELKMETDEIKEVKEVKVKEVKVDKREKREREVTVQLPPSPKEDDSEKEVSNIGLNRKISIVNDEASKLQPPPSPPKNPISSILFITNLVRPFTVKQLKELLSRNGKILDDGFWTDRIKSKCYVQYENEEEAEATRNALHGVQWPIGNGKKLIIDFGNLESLEEARNAVVETVVSNPVKTVPEKVVEKVPEVEKKPVVQEKEEEEERWTKRRSGGVGGSPTREHSRSEKRQHTRHDDSPSNGDHLARKKKKEEQPEVKLMDDLFHKTKATPSIYWLPLTPDQIAKKQQERLQRMAEHKRRMEESRRTENVRDFGRGALRSRRRTSHIDGN